MATVSISTLITVAVLVFGVLGENALISVFNDATEDRKNQEDVHAEYDGTSIYVHNKGQQNAQVLKYRFYDKDGNLVQEIQGNSSFPTNLNRFEQQNVDYVWEYTNISSAELVTSYGNLIPIKDIREHVIYIGSNVNPNKIKIPFEFCINTSCGISVKPFNPLIIYVNDTNPLIPGNTTTINPINATITIYIDPVDPNDPRQGTHCKLKINKNIYIITDPATALFKINDIAISLDKCQLDVDTKFGTVKGAGNENSKIVNALSTNVRLVHYDLDGDLWIDTISDTSVTSAEPYNYINFEHIDYIGMVNKDDTDKKYIIPKLAGTYSGTTRESTTSEDRSRYGMGNTVDTLTRIRDDVKTTFKIDRIDVMNLIKPKSGFKYEAVIVLDNKLYVVTANNKSGDSWMYISKSLIDNTPGLRENSLSNLPQYEAVGFDGGELYGSQYHRVDQRNINNVLNSTCTKYNIYGIHYIPNNTVVTLTRDGYIRDINWSTCGDTLIHKHADVVNGKRIYFEGITKVGDSYLSLADDGVYIYNANALETLKVDLDPRNTDPVGIAYKYNTGKDSHTIFVLDNDDQVIYVYRYIDSIVVREVRNADGTLSDVNFLVANLDVLVDDEGIIDISHIDLAQLGELTGLEYYDGNFIIMTKNPNKMYIEFEELLRTPFTIHPLSTREIITSFTGMTHDGSKIYATDSHGPRAVSVVYDGTEVKRKEDIEMRGVIGIGSILGVAYMDDKFILLRHADLDLNPRGVTTDVVDAVRKPGKIYDPHGSSVHIFDKNGQNQVIKLLSTQHGIVSGITVMNDEVYIVDWKKNRIFVYDKTFDVDNIKKIILPKKDYSSIADNGTHVFLLDAKESRIYSFKPPHINADEILEIKRTLPPNKPYEIYLDETLVRRGFTDNKGSIYVDLANTGHGGDKNERVMIKVYDNSNSLKVTNKIKENGVIIDHYNKQTYKYKMKSDIIYLPIGYAKMPIPSNITISNFTIHSDDYDIKMKVINGDYKSGDYIHIPVIPKFHSMSFVIDDSESPTILRFSDISGLTVNRLISYTENTRVENNADKYIDYMTTTSTANAFKYATSDGDIKFQLTAEVSGKLQVTNGLYMLSLVHVSIDYKHHGSHLPCM